jgi:hypothetical protein
MDQKHCVRDLFAALGRLDVLIERATKAADASYGNAPHTDPYRGLYISPDDVTRMLAREPGAPMLAGQDGGERPEYPLMTELANRFGLEAFDQDVILLAAAPEIDLRYERLYAYLHDDVTRKRPSVDLALGLLCASREAKVVARSRFAASAPLIRNHLIELVGDPAGINPPLLENAIRVDDTVLRFLLCADGVDARIAGFCEMEPQRTRDAVSVSHLPLERLESMARDIRQSGRNLRFYFEGPRQSSKRQVANALAARLDAPMLVCSVSRMPAEPTAFESAFGIVIREAGLNNAVLYLENIDSIRDTPTNPVFARKLGDGPPIAILDGERSWAGQQLEVVTFSLPQLSYEERLKGWRDTLERSKLDPPKDLADLAGLFRLGNDEIRRATESAADQARLAGRMVTEEDLFAASRAQSTRDLGPLAQYVAPAYQWTDLVLPPERMTQLHEIANQARFRHVVLDDWGFGARLSLGKGLSALFSGPPGTGKTMAAEVVARDLHLDLFKIDLSQIVSKYIGETEKNLGRVFSQAKAGNSILFFDEADALFGKRSEVKDAHDRYANIEIAYLLQEIDQYEGLCILATNLRQNLDPAFTRRLTFIVDFPFPDEESRRRIWKTIWPKQFPLSGDVDLAHIARQFRMAGGSVKNVALGAAFLAASEGAQEVSTRHLVQAARRELEKMGRSVTKADLGSLADDPAVGRMLEVRQ